MAGINKVILVGNLGADPELRFTGSGTAVGELRLATSRKFKGKDGSMQDDTQWHRVVVWGKQAEQCKEFLAKGRQIYVEGRLQTRQWEDKDGNKRWTTEVIAQTIQFLGNRASGGMGDSSYGGGDSSFGGSSMGGGGGFESNDQFSAPDFGDDEIPF